MSKTVLKLRPNDYWKIGEHESWFTDMAAKGLHIKKTGLIFAKFEKGESMDIRYRIDVVKDSLTDEQKSLYKEYGWEFVMTYGKFNVFSSPKELGAEELHTDASEQSYTLKDLDKQLHQNVVTMSIIMILFLGMMLSVFFFNSAPFLSMVKGQFLQQCILVVVELYVFYTTIQASRSIRALKKSLFDGTEIDHHANWRKGGFTNKMIGGIFMVAAFFTIVLPMMTIMKSENYTLPEGKSSLPIVRLADIENNADYLRKSGYIQDEVDWGNRLSYDWSPFATIQYEADEHGIVTNTMWKDSSGGYSPSISTQYYKLAFKGMADGLINDLQERFLYENDKEIQIISHPDFDKLYIVENDETKQIFASIGKNVLYIRYHGYADIDRIITLASEKLSVESK
jgi:uncharacterized membrane protein